MTTPPFNPVAFNCHDIRSNRPDKGYHPQVGKLHGFRVYEIVLPKFRLKDVGKIFIRCYPFIPPTDIVDWSYMSIFKDDIPQYTYKFLGFNEEGELKLEKNDEQLFINPKYNDGHWILLEEYKYSMETLTISLKFLK